MITHELLINKGFQLNEYPEGKYYEFTETKELKIECILKVAGIEYDSECIDEKVILQMKEDFTQKLICVDGNVWYLKDFEFDKILNAIKWINIKEQLPPDNNETWG